MSDFPCIIFHRLAFLSTYTVNTSTTHTTRTTNTHNNSTTRSTINNLQSLSLIGESKTR